MYFLFPDRYKLYTLNDCLNQNSLDQASIVCSEDNPDR